MSDDGLGTLRGDAKDGTTIPPLSHDVTYNGIAAARQRDDLGSAQVRPRTPFQEMPDTQPHRPIHRIPAKRLHPLISHHLAIRIPSKIRTRTPDDWRFACQWIPCSLRASHTTPWPTPIVARDIRLIWSATRPSV
jgi:hypothetical protein